MDRIHMFPQSIDTINLETTYIAVECKKLRLSDDKSKQMHVSKKKEVCVSTLKVHEKEMSKVESIVYLGDSINVRGSMDETVKARELKSVGIHQS